jgi:hypothetical protein
MKSFLLLPALFCLINLNGQIIQTTKAREEAVFEKIETEAGFGGGAVKWSEYVKKNFSFARIENALPDSVISFRDTARVQFVVDKNGIIKDIRFLSVNLSAFQQSCREVYKNSPHWRPANQCGRSVNAFKKEIFILHIDKAAVKRIILVRS